MGVRSVRRQQTSQCKRGESLGEALPLTQGVGRGKPYAPWRACPAAPTAQAPAHAGGHGTGGRDAPSKLGEHRGTPRGSYPGGAPAWRRVILSSKLTTQAKRVLPFTRSCAARARRRVRMHAQARPRSRPQAGFCRVGKTPRLRDSAPRAPHALAHARTHEGPCPAAGEGVRSPPGASRVASVLFRATCQRRAASAARRPARWRSSRTSSVQCMTASSASGAWKRSPSAPCLPLPLVCAGA